MKLSTFLIPILFVLSSCSVHVYRPIESFSVAPYTRPLTAASPHGEKIAVYIDPMIQKIQLSKIEGGNFSEFFSYNDYRNSIKNSIHNMLSNNFTEIEFYDEVPTNGLVLRVHRIKPKLKAGEQITEHVFTTNFMHDYDLSLSRDNEVIANAVGYNAHPTVSYNNRKRRWAVAAQGSLKLVLEDCYNQLFVEGLGKS